VETNMETVRRYGRLAAADTPLRSKLPEERKRETKDKIEARKRARLIGHLSNRAFDIFEKR